MNKILLIIKREYLSRVRKRSFIIMSVLGPLLFGSILVIPIWLATRDNEEKMVVVKDDSGFFVHKLKANNIEFIYTNESIENLLLSDSTILHIPTVDIDKTAEIFLYGKNNHGIEFENNIENSIEKEIRSIKLSKLGLSEGRLDSLNVHVNLHTRNSRTGEEEADSGVASVVGYIGAFAIYMFIFIYGAQVMRGVAEEKTNRIVEVIISSVKPFQLMMGKILGIALVVLTQLTIWVVFTTAIYTTISAYYADEMKLLAETQQEQSLINNPGGTKIEQAKMLSQIADKVEGFPVLKTIFSFIFFFLAGYLMYAALFAMVGSAVDSMEDSQQFMLPITIPLIASIIVLSAVLQDPHGSLAFWMSVIPLTSPVVMMMRVPFDVPNTELLLSMFLLVAGFIFTTWFAGRIYRVGILMHGSKVNYKTLWKWFFMTD